MKNEDNVIHVRFGPGGGRRVDPPEPLEDEDAEPLASPEPAPPAAFSRERAADPYAGLFQAKEVARLFDLPLGRLRYWDRILFISPSGRVGWRRFYTFSDLIGIRAAKELLDQGASLSVVRDSVYALRASLPHVTRPLNELRVRSDGRKVVVHDANRVYEATTGQLRLDFEVRELRDDVVRVLEPAAAVDPKKRQEAYEHYLEGCRLDEDEGTYQVAERAYERAIALDPSLANALTNWGNLRFRQGDVEHATRLYERALALDPEQPEALYNLGYLAFERGDAAAASRHFERAVSFDPGFADAHFNLAMSLEELGRTNEARPHWQTYLDLDPTGSWADIARKYLAGKWR
ncbi:MAG: tetratricopeptide repeat protein [Sandaracinaceae bacterium]|nr:tetratricopeptide repeat protein [Sandaracinaceae bacterium]